MGQFLEYVKMALDNIRSNKGRSFLTMLGIIIGITSVVTIVSIGNGLKKDVVDQVSTLNNTVTVQANTEEVTNPNCITGDDISYLKTNLSDSVQSVYAYSSAAGVIETRKGKFDTYIGLTTPDYENAQYSSPVIKGNYFTDNDVANANMVCVIDELTALYFFGNTDVIGMTIELQVENSIQNVNIIGIRETSEEMLAAEKQYLAMGMDKSISLEMPYTVSSAFGNPIDAFPSVSISVYDANESPKVTKTAVQILNSRHKDLADKPFIQQKPLDISDMYSSLMDGVTAFVALVAGISLIVGGIGVMNIMLVSVTERTREIGIRKALGAKTGSIISQFLCESAIISGMGGIIGILLGAALTALITALGIGGIRAQLSFPAVLVATIFSCSVGIVFGIYPAKKAAQLSPIEALRRM